MRLARLIPFARAARADLLIGLGLLACAAAVEVMQPWPIKWLVDNVLGSLPASPFVASLLGNTRARGLATVCAAVVLIALTHRAVLVIAHNLLVRAGNKLVAALRGALCDHLHTLSPAYHDRTKVGDSVHRLTYDSLAGLNAVSQVVTPIASGVLVLLGIIAVMLTIDPRLTGIAVLAAPALWLLIRLFGRVIDRRAKAYHQSENALAAETTEALTQIRIVQAFGHEKTVSARVKQRAATSLHAMQKLVFTQLLYGAATAIALAAGTAAVVYVGASAAANGRLTTGDVLVFLTYVAMLYMPLNQISTAAASIHTVRAQLSRVFEVLDILPAIRNRPGAAPLPSVAGRIEFQSLSFAYEPDRPILRDINLSVAPGQTVAIVGRTGSGKTTLMSLLTRFYDPTLGSIKLDGADLRDLPVAWLRDQISIVLQDAMLMSGTIRENIALGAPRNSSPTDADIQRAARLAQADSFIQDAPEQYETPLGERGINLSGGQKQRLAIARAFLKNAPILILDEPTSALDAHTEFALVDAIRDLSRGRTTFIIAHRLSTIRLADLIVVMDEGRIVEQGTHEQLLAKNNAYSKLYNAQWGDKTGHSSDPVSELETPETVGSL